MKKKTVYHLKPAVKYTIYIIIVLAIVGAIIGKYYYDKHQEYLYTLTYEYKLTELGYNEDEQKKLQDNLNDSELDVVLTYEYNEFIPEFVKCKYFIFENLDKYLGQVITQEDDFFKYHGTEGYDYDNIVALVNVHEPEEKYTGEYITNRDDNYAMLSNKYYKLGEDYEPDDLVKIDMKYYYGSEKEIRNEVYEAFKEMWQAAKDENNIYLVIISGYRSAKDQKEVYDKYENQKGVSYADSIAARPGYSEHQTGLALDIYSKTNTKRETFKDSDAYKWLIANSYKYGFILRYPEGKKKITGYDYESWHYRYVGKDLAKKVYESGLTYDEYYEFYLKK